MIRALGAAALLLAACVSRGHAQAAGNDSTARCDSIIAAARVDSVHRGVFFTIGRIDGGELFLDQANVMTLAVATAFEPPIPLRMSVFEGAAQMSGLRRRNADTATVLRAPTLTGVYRFTSTRTQAIAHIETVRSSLIADFDRAVIAAIRSAAVIKQVVEVSPDEDSMRVELRVSTDSMLGSRRVLTSLLPQMPVIDAVALANNPPTQFPDSVKDESTGDVVLRFVVGPDGTPNNEAVEVARAQSMAFVRAALVALNAQRFAPATIRGCPVAQLVDYPFTFARSLSEKSPPHD